MPTRRTSKTSRRGMSTRTTTRQSRTTHKVPGRKVPGRAGLAGRRGTESRLGKDYDEMSRGRETSGKGIGEEYELPRGRGGAETRWAGEERSNRSRGRTQGARRNSSWS